MPVNAAQSCPGVHGKGRAEQMSVERLASVVFTSMPMSSASSQHLATVRRRLGMINGGRMGAGPLVLAVTALLPAAPLRVIFPLLPAQPGPALLLR